MLESDDMLGDVIHRFYFISTCFLSSRSKTPNRSITAALLAILNLHLDQLIHRASTVTQSDHHDLARILIHVRPCMITFHSHTTKNPDHRPLLPSVQNNLLYVALSNLDTPTFLVTSQLKIPSTALFSVLIFKKELSSLQWLSLLLLTSGVSLVQLRPQSIATKAHVLNLQSQDSLNGLMAIILSSLSSGLAGCWFEKLVKKPYVSKPIPNPTTHSSHPDLTLQDRLSDSLWVKNVQLACFTIPFAYAAIYLNPHYLSDVKARGFFSGYGPLVWSVILYHALGGILVSIIVKQTSTVTKSFANSLSIVCKSFFFGLLPCPLT